MTEPARSPVRMVWAQAADGVIGADGALPWHLPEDLRMFRALTAGSTVVMGRRTWESLPPRFRPLPGRRNLVLSSTMAEADTGASVARSVDDVLAAGPPASGKDLWVIGGGGVYAAFLPHASEVVVTEVDVRPPGDTWAPRLGREWTCALRLPAAGWAESSGGLRFRVSLWQRGTCAPGSVRRLLADQQLTWSRPDGAPVVAAGVGRFEP